MLAVSGRSDAVLVSWHQTRQPQLTVTHGSDRDAHLLPRPADRVVLFVEMTNARLRHNVGACRLRLFLSRAWRSSTFCDFTRKLIPGSKVSLPGCRSFCRLFRAGSKLGLHGKCVALCGTPSLPAVCSVRPLAARQPDGQGRGPCGR